MPSVRTTRPNTTCHLVLFEKIKNLKKCYGCAKNFANKHTIPPHDIILQHFTKRKYRKQNGEEAFSTNVQAVYFHLNLTCVRKAVPTMEIDDVIIHDDVKYLLTEGHKSLLCNFGIELA